MLVTSFADASDGSDSVTAPTKRTPLRAIVRIPDCRQEIVLGDHAVAIFKQIDQQIEHLRFDRDQLLAVAQFPRIGIKHMI